MFYSFLCNNPLKNFIMSLKLCNFALVIKIRYLIHGERIVNPRLHL